MNLTIDDSLALLRAFLRDLGPATTKVGGTLGIMVPGRCALVNLDVPGGQWVDHAQAGDCFDATCCLVTHPLALAKFFVDPAGAKLDLQAGFTTVLGDTTVLTRLGEFLSGAGNALTQLSLRSAS